MNLTTITHTGFTGYSDVIVYDQYGHNIVFMSLFGNKSNLKAIHAALISKIPVQIKEADKSNRQYMSLSKDYDFNSTIKHIDPVSALDHVIYYPTSASYQYINPDMKNIIFLFRKDRSKDEIQKAFYLYLDKALPIPIHRAWTINITQAMMQEGLITELPTIGISAWHVELWQDKIIQIISKQIKKGKFNVN